MSEAKSGGVVEGNVAVRMCNADYGTQNYAGVWAMSVDDGLFQYNEVYGIKYGFNDAEAYDVDMQSNNVIYQYNYSHHNTGGFYCLCLIKNSVIRYNISANDGGGNRGTGKDNPGGAGGYNYKEQSIFHYWVKMMERQCQLSTIIRFMLATVFQHHYLVKEIVLTTVVQ